MATTRSVDGSLLCEGYELRVTARCLSEDLDAETDRPFDDLAGEEIIAAFVAQRSVTPEDRRRIDSLASARTVCRLKVSERERGATWHDDDCQVVWLLARADEAFGEEDANAYFKYLEEQDGLFPTPDDYDALFDDRTSRLIEALAVEGSELVRGARAQPGQEQRAIIGGQIHLSVVVRRMGPVEEVLFALPGDDFRDDLLGILIAALAGDQESCPPFETIRAFPNRALTADEIGLRLVLD